MGRAIIIKDIDFSSLNLGTVTPAEVIPIAAVTIEGSHTVYNNLNEADYSVIYSPVGTTETGVVWSIESGGTYATVNRTTGKLSVLPAADGNNVVLRATSLYNASVYDEITILVTYYDVALRSISIVGPSSINNITNSEQYSVAYTPSDTSQTGVSWSSSDNSVATVDQQGKVTVLSSGTVTITATSSQNPEIADSLQVACTYNSVETNGYIYFSSAINSVINLAKPAAAIGNTTIQMKVMTGTGGGFFFGCRNAGRTVSALLYSRTKVQAVYGGISVDNLAALLDGQMHIFSMGSVFTIDGVQQGGTNASADSFPDVLSIPYTTGGDPYFGQACEKFGIEYISITENSIETHRYVAAQVGSDCGLLDTVTGEYISLASKGAAFVSTT